MVSDFPVLLQDTVRLPWQDVAALVTCAPGRLVHRGKSRGCSWEKSVKSSFSPGYRSDNACSRRPCAWERGLYRVFMLQLPLWSSGTQSACLKVMFVIRKANTPWCGPLHCVHSISSEGSPETPVSDGYDTTRYDWDGALRGALLFGLSGRRGEPLFS